MKRKLAFALVSAATLAVAPAFAEGEAAPATETTTTTTATATAAPAATGGEKEFGDAGTINIGAATNLNFAASSTKVQGNDAGKSTAFGLQVEAAYFVIQNLSVGLGVGFNSLSTKDAAGNDGPSSTTINIGPRVGYNIWLSPPTLSLWPQVGIDYRSTSNKVKGNDAGSSSAMSLGIWVPLLIHPVKHFHFGVGPFVSLDLSATEKDPAGNSTDGPKTTTFGLKGEIAGWL